MMPIFTPLPKSLEPALLRPLMRHALRHALRHLPRLALGSLRHARQRWRQQCAARATLRSLAHLDDATLHDLGLHRSEVASLSAELAGTTRVERLQALQARSRLS